MVVTPGGSRLWRLAYRFGGKQKLLALGKYPDVKLGDARLERERARQLLDDGIDPSDARRAEKRRKTIAAGHTFRSVADEWFDAQKARWVDSYSDRLRSRLDADLSLPDRMEAYEAQILKDTLAATKGDVRTAMQRLGVPRKTLYDKLRRHGIDIDAFRR